MKQFFNDMIHMTEGEKLVHYWPLWLGIVLLVIAVTIFSRKKKL